MLYRSVEVPLDELQARLAPLEARDIRRLAGGASSLTYAATAEGGRAVVVKVAPAGVAPVLHGDFRLGNMLAAGPDVRAIIDWEIWTVGDPRLDLGWFLVNADPGTYGRRTRYAGVLPSPAELAAIYGDGDGDVDHLDWFTALACFKSVATWSLIVKHNRRRPDPDPELEAMATLLPHLLSRAAGFL